ncbi:MAG: hypothetical protein WCG83_04275 [Candidatus Peregrinibacteria bacterium]
MSHLRRFPALIGLTMIAVGVAALHSLAVSLPAEGAQATATTDRPLFLTLSHSPDKVNGGDHVSYVIALRSTNPIVGAYTINLTLPSGVAARIASDGGIITGTTVRWSGIAVSSTSERRLFVEVDTDLAIATNEVLTATVTAGAEKASDSFTIAYNPNALNLSPLKVTVSNGVDFAAPTDSLRYIITVGNPTSGDRTFTLSAQMPTYFSLLAATGRFTNDTNTLSWRNELIRAGESVTYEVTGTIFRDAPEFYAMVFSVNIDGHIANDTTIIKKKDIIADFDVSLSDGQENAAPGSLLTYQVRLTNNEDALASELPVTVAFPTYLEFVSAENGGVWTGNSIRWSNVTVSPHGARALTFAAHVRTDAPIGSVLRTSAESNGLVGVDTTVVDTGVQTPVVAAPVTGPTALLRKVADRSEVRPGDTVGYTVMLRNSSDHPFQNVRIEDRFDPSLMTVVGGERGQMQNNTLVWTVPTIAPGETWKVRYVVRISENAPHGSTIDNVVSASGEGLETISLTERVTTTQLDVVRRMPPTGAAFDQIFLVLAGSLSVAQTFLFKKRRLA